MSNTELLKLKLDLEKEKALRVFEIQKLDSIKSLTHEFIKENENKEIPTDKVCSLINSINEILCLTPDNTLLKEELPFK